MRYLRRRYLIATAAAWSSLSVGTPPAAAATLGWTAAPVTGVDDVRTDGTLLYAFDFAGQAFEDEGRTVELNGVPFASENVNPGALNGTGGGQLKLLNFDRGVNDLYRSDDPPFADLPDAYQTLLTGAKYQAAAPSQAQPTLQLTGLRAGTRYVVQIWGSDPRGTGSDRHLMLAGGGDRRIDLNLDPENAEGGLPAFATAEFVADGPTQDVVIDGGVSVNVAALQVRRLPADAEDADDTRRPDDGNNGDAGEPQ